MTQTLRDSVYRKSALIQDLTALGVPADCMDQIMATANEYMSLNEKLDAERFTQFLLDAHAVLFTMDQSPSKNAAILGEWLRFFAEYIVEQAIHVMHSNPELSVKGIVDRIAPMNDVDEKEVA
jgi:hypothetical protein